MSKYTESANPYTLRFSFIPPRIIARTAVTEEIVSNFVRDIPTYSGMFITGVRGSGKTVLMGEIRNRIESAADWVTVDLNPESNLLDSLARNLYLIPEIRALFVKAKLDFTVLGIGLHIEDAELVASNEEDAVLMMLRILKAAGKKVLVTIDEVTYSKDVARFSHALSSYSNYGLEVFVLMTGLSENIKSIKNKKSLTFLYRAKVMEPDTLNITAISKEYRETLNLTRELSDDMAYLTRGYSLAFQALGYHLWNDLCRCKTPDNIDISRVIDNLDLTLAELAYDKIWDELSAVDKEILCGMVQLQKQGNELLKVENIRAKLGIDSDKFTVYRSRLLDAGVIDGSQYGYLRFKLPRFEEYIGSLMR